MFIVDFLLSDAAPILIPFTTLCLLCIFATMQSVKNARKRDLN